MKIIMTVTMKKNKVDYIFEYDSNSSSDDCGNDSF